MPKEGHGSRAVAFAVLDHGRRGVGRGEDQRLFRANFDATAATDAQQPVNRPAFLGTLNDNGTRRASLGANVAIYAGRFRELNHTTRAGNRNAGRHRVMGRDRFAHDPLERQTSHFEAGHINAPCN